MKASRPLLRPLLALLCLALLAACRPASPAAPVTPAAAPDLPAEAELRQAADTAFSQGDWAAAGAALEGLLALRPDDAASRYRLALLLAAEDPGAARAPLEQAAALDPALEAPAQALLQSLRVAGRCPDPACALVESGRGLAGLEEWSLAARAFERAASLRPDYAEAWAFLGEALQHLPAPAASQREAALTALIKALELDPDSVSTYLLLSLYWQRQGHYGRGLDYARQAAELDPLSPAAVSESGACLARTGDLPAALEAYRRAAALAPRDPAYLRLLAAFTLEYDHQVREAGLPAARRAVLLNPDDPASPVVLGQVLFKLGDLTGAERFFRRALELDPAFAPAHLHLGLVHLLQEDPAAAYEQFSLARSLASGTPLAEQAERLIASNFQRLP